jgi:uncharacterized delta-60 repeat protein
MPYRVRHRSRRQPRLRAGDPARRCRRALGLEALEERTLLSAGILRAGLPDPTFIPLSRVLGIAEAVVVQPDGKTVVAGQINLTTGTATLQLAVTRYNGDGSLDTTFANNGTAITVLAVPQTSALPFEARLALEPNGDIVALGLSDVIRLTASGMPDPTFGNNGVVLLAGQANNLALQPDGKIVIVGANLERLNANGGLDTSFGAGGEVTLVSPQSTVAVQGDGRIIVAGSIVARFNPNGTLDSTFGIGGVAAIAFTAEDVALQTNGQIVMAGAIQDPTRTALMDFVVARLDVNGLADTTFGNDGLVITQVLDKSQANSVLIQSDGKIVAAGSAAPAENGQPSFALVRYNPDGAVDTTFGNQNDGQTIIPNTGGTGANGAALQADGKIIAVGTFLVPNGAGGGVNAFDVTRFTADPPISDPDQRFLSQVYLDLLQRPLDPAGLAGWSSAMIGGAARTEVIAEIEASQEYRTLEVQYLYGLLLERPVEPAGLAGWIGFLNHGGTIEQVEAQILGSNEYFLRAASTNAGYLQRLYADVLHRPIDSAGAQFWSQALASGMTRSQVAADVLGSPEASMDEVQALYLTLLRRAADPTGLATFTMDLQQGMSAEAVIATIVGSDEYVARLFGGP